MGTDPDHQQGELNLRATRVLSAVGRTRTYNIDLARAIGLLEACFLEQVELQCQYASEALVPDKRLFHEGQWYAHRTLEAWLRICPIGCRLTLQRVIERCEAKGVLNSAFLLNQKTKSFSLNEKQCIHVINVMVTNCYKDDNTLLQSGAHTTKENSFNKPSKTRVSRGGGGSSSSPPDSNSASAMQMSHVHPALAGWADDDVVPGKLLELDNMQSWTPARIFDRLQLEAIPNRVRRPEIDAQHIIRLEQKLRSAGSLDQFVRDLRRYFQCEDDFAVNNNRDVFTFCRFPSDRWYATHRKKSVDGNSEPARPFVPATYKHAWGGSSPAPAPPPAAPVPQTAKQLIAELKAKEQAQRAQKNQVPTPEDAAAITDLRRRMREDPPPDVYVSG